jgi:hypothetical protein
MQFRHENSQELGNSGCRRAPRSSLVVAGILIFALLTHAAMPTGPGGFAMQQGQGNEETDSRELPVNEEVAGSCELAPSRSSRPEVTSLESSFSHCAVDANRVARLRVRMVVPAEQAGRNGTGGPLRC